MKQALGIMEIKGLVFTIACSDTALKAADVELLGYEPSKGGACFVVKILGNVGAVRAALDAASALAGKNEVGITSYSIPRPSTACWGMVTESVTREAADPKKPVENASNPSGEEPAAGEQASEQEAEPAEQPSEQAGNRTAELPEATETPAEVRPGVCNLCGDPKCPRRKNEPHSLCIHFDELTH